MPVHERDPYQRAAKAWRALTGGDLWWLHETTPAALPVPLEVRRALLEGRRLEGQEIAGRYWWVLFPPGVEGAAPGLVAWANQLYASTQWLDLVLDLLTDLQRERMASQALTHELAHAWDRLALLYELARIARHDPTLAASLPAIVRLIREAVGSREALVLVRGEGGPLAAAASGAFPGDPAAWLGLLPEVSQTVQKTSLPPWAADLLPYPDFLLAPLRAEGETVGLIGWSRDGQAPPGAADLQLLASVAEQVGALVAAARIRQARETARRLQHELTIATGIQENLLPVDLPAPPGFDLEAYLRPAQRVGGDFYDVAVGPGGEVFLLLADVAGKGVAAAMLTSVVHASFQTEVLHRRDPAGLLGVMNRVLFPELDRAGVFVTVVVVRLEADPPHLVYASAGHVEPLLFRAGAQKPRLLPATGLPLGVQPDQPYRVRRLRLRPGDVVLLYSDGVTEAQDEAGKVLGREGLVDIMYAVHPAPATEQVRGLVRAIDMHRGLRPLKDDAALLLVRVHPEREPIWVRPFVLAAGPGTVGEVVSFIRGLAETPGWPVEPGRRARLLEDFALALVELVSNQIRHAYRGQGGRIQGRVTLTAEALTADLYDSGVPFRGYRRAARTVDPSDPPERGFGLPLMEGLADQVLYRRLPGRRNHWRLTKRLRGGVA